MQWLKTLAPWMFFIAIIAPGLFVYDDDKGGAEPSSAMERCRPRENGEMVRVWLQDGHIQCESHQRVAYGMACPVKGRCAAPVSVD